MRSPTAQPLIRVALVNDFELVLRGIETMLAGFADRVVVSELDVDTNPGHRVDVALFDTYGHLGGGIERVQSLAHDARVGAVALYTWSLPPGQLDAALAAGARGALAKSTTGAALADALIAIHRGSTVVSPEFRGSDDLAWPGRDFGLTQRESEVAALLAQGCSNREIAGALFVSEHTVKSHLKAIFRKAGVPSRARAVASINDDAGFRRVRSRV